MARKKNQNKIETVQAEPVVVDLSEEQDDNENDDEKKNNNNDDNDEDYEEDELELLQVDLGDTVKVKQILDETVAGVILERLGEDHRWDNLKLIIMAAACAFAMVAQFAPVPFPDSRPLLGVCGCAYFILSGVLQFIASFVDEDAILLTKAWDADYSLDHEFDDVDDSDKNTTIKQTCNNDLLKEHGVRVRSSLPRFSEWYTVALEFQIKEKAPYSEQRWSIGKFFDKEGYFDEIGLMQEIETLYDRFEDGQYEKNEEEKKKQ